MSKIEFDGWKGVKAAVKKFAESNGSLRKKQWEDESSRNDALEDDALKSKEELFIALKELKKTYPGIQLPKNADALSNEVFGPRAMIFLTCGNMLERRALEDELEKRGVPVYRNYCCAEGNCHQDSPVLNLRVKYFKGYHWNE